jgi:carboxypeptidase C (cathepsin A)
MRKNKLKKYPFYCTLMICTALFGNSCQKKNEDSIFYELFNAKYKNDTVRTVNMPDNLSVINNLTKELTRNQIEINAYNVDATEPEYNFVHDCVNLVTYYIERTGMRMYAVKSEKQKVKYRRRSQSNKRIRGYYQEFKICVYEFENEETAKVNYEILQKAASSGDGKCNDIFNTEFILKKNEIFEFWTMDRKSLGHMREYINFVERQ